ncbi:membrane protein [Streptomyces noursei ATCC 11455]|uniref:hypothetical protein n=1 Tax=Streptomyces noursei TaxID=1971 RepID=UPI00081CC18E|nr:membrane protein [Streptomyces noursei ATCC 11455]
MKRIVWAVAALAVVALDVYLLRYHWSDVGGNIEASIIWGTPALVAQHVALRRHVNRTHAATVERFDAQDEALDATHRKVGELHGLHLHGKWPDGSPDTR